MKERPILMSGPTIRAILDDRKTAMRRVAGTPPAGSESVLKRPGDTFANTFWNGEQWETQNIEVSSYCLCHTRQMRRYNPPTNTGKIEWYQWESSPFYCPYGKPGDRLWVRETWATPGNYDHIKPSDLIDTMCHEIVYRATELYPVYYNWRPSIHMPRWASRITLEITGVKVERLQDISEEDALAEGLYTLSNRDGTFYNYNSGIEPRYWWTDPISAFVALWQSINGKRPGCNWDSDPLVWVIEFKRIESES